MVLAALQVLVGAFTPLALSSLGGLGIYAAPVLLPLLWLTTNACRGAGRWYFTILAALLASQTAWAISWNLLPGLEAALPILAVAATTFLFVKTWHRGLPIRTVVLILAALGTFGLTGMGAIGVGGETATQEVRQPPVSTRLREE